MATALKTAAITRNQPATTASDSTLVAVREEYSLLAALVVSDTIDFLKLPARHVLVDVIVDSDDLDTGGSPAITLHAGLRAADGVATDDPDAFLVSSTVGQAGGVARAAAVAGFRIAAADFDRNVYLTVAVAPATGATTGKIGVTAFYRPA